MTSGFLGRAMLAGTFVIGLPGILVAQEYVAITSEREFIAKMSERKVTLLHKSGSQVMTYHYDGRISGEIDGRPYDGTWTWDGSGLCFTARKEGNDYSSSGCADLSMKGDEVKYAWRDFSPEFFRVGN
jgi:hypothetical protein